MKSLFFTLCITLLGFNFSYSQEMEERKSIDVNEIEVWTKKIELNAKGDTATVELYLQSYLKNPREFKLNTFSTGLLSGSDVPLWYETMQLGKVRIHISDRQNYLHYLLTRNESVVLTIKTGGWKKQWGKPKQLKLAIEDYEEQGKILEYTIDL